MLTHKIKAPSIVRRLVDSVFNGVNLNPMPRTPAPPAPSPPVLLADIRYDKQKFIHFIEKTRESYKVGDMVTYSSQRPCEGIIPVSLYRIIYIQELWFDVQYDYSGKEPKVLLVRNMNYDSGADMSVAPCRMRHLTKEETDLVNLRDSKVQGTA